MHACAHTAARRLLAARPAPHLQPPAARTALTRLAALGRLGGGSTDAAGRWLASLPSLDSGTPSSPRSLSRAIIAAADGLAGTGPNNLKQPWDDISSSSSSSGVQLHEQLISLAAGFCVPQQASVPVHQLIAVWWSALAGSSLLELPKDARTRRMAVKWRVLQLLLVLAREQEQAAAAGAAAACPAFEGQLELLLEEVLLGSSARKLAKVLANERVPAPNKALAARRHDALWATCHASLAAWARDAVASDAFALLRPAMELLAPAVDDSVFGVPEALAAAAAAAAGGEAGAGSSLGGGSSRGGATSSSSGRLMEQAALQAVQDALPPGWCLLSNLHLMGVDGRLLSNPQRGCKYELDMLVLDDTGLAVCIIEVKLAAANPLMALLNDVASLLRLVDIAAGQTITLITKDAGTAARAATAAAAAGVAAAAAAAASRPAAHAHHHGAVAALAASAVAPGCDAAFATQGSSSDLARRLNARPPFAAALGSGRWHTVEVAVSPELLPVYVLGRDISPGAMQRGLSSLISSSALKHLARSPAALAAALSTKQEPWAQVLREASWQQQQQAAAPRSSSMEVDGAVDSDSSSDCSSNSDEESSFTDSSSTSSSSSAMGGLALPRAAEVALSAARGRIRASLVLTAEQQAFLTASIIAKLTVLRDRCRIFCLCADDGETAAAAAQPSCDG